MPSSDPDMESMSHPLSPGADSAAHDPHDEAGLYRDELTNLAAVIRPVAICMVLASLVVAYVRDQTFDAALSSGLSTYLVINQDAASSAGKDEGTLFGEGLLNALVIVGVIMAAAFVMALCLYFRLTWLLAGYIMFAMTMLLGYTGGFMLFTTLTAYRVPMSYPTMAVLMWNFAIVGVISIFYQRGVPRSLTQWYLIAVGSIMAWTLSKFPEWTSWALLLMLALYDLCAVLTPCGPLRCLINLMQTRNVSMSGLVYEADVAPAGPPGAAVPEHLRAYTGQRDTLAVGRPAVGRAAAQEGRPASATAPPAPGASTTAVAPAPSPPASSSSSAPRGEPADPAASSAGGHHVLTEGVSEGAPIGDEPASGGRPANELEAMGDAMSSSIKLGLGDFVFYSVLVSRAALAGLTTFAACFVAILCGLAGTIALLAVLQRALPALPISIFLGLVIFFVVRLALVPLVVLFSASGIVA
ncbi:hypothetical protein FNF29_03223 [Cafeteria roenbergensis]|uniref:Presenilin n=1 Tax=Cafeteria roenbergensis TaxID=33653 RepID=A0A5A8CK28_CAFRO|nr:hypothetical protein FNF29_03223 [Cafeteria roenbergensis]|eukprot:KAA0153406.1 hypothetical protein FNF29_03223 [Cafeteria roenbergensis]